MAIVWDSLPRVISSGSKYWFSVHFSQFDSLHWLELCRLAAFEFCRGNGEDFVWFVIVWRHLFSRLISVAGIKSNYANEIYVDEAGAEF